MLPLKAILIYDVPKLAFFFLAFLFLIKQFCGGGKGSAGWISGLQTNEINK